MSSLLIKISLGVVASAAAYFFFFWKNQRRVPEECLYRNVGNYDGSNLSHCCICLKEFSLLLKNEIVSFPCRHKICKECCSKLFSVQAPNYRTCPQCRQPIPDVYVM